MYDVLIIGGGAAGFFTAINVGCQDPTLKIAVLERGKEVLSKVKVSGGGRCNVAHAQFVPAELVLNYPRGEKELLGPFHTFCSGDTMAFFEERGVPLKIEEDGRIFPVSDSSQTIVDCFMDEVHRLGIQLLRNSSVTDIFKNGPSWTVRSIHKEYRAEKIVVATGSNPRIWQILQGLGHRIEPPVPSLFTFNIKDDRISNIPGISTNARVEVIGIGESDPKITITLKSRLPQAISLESEGPLLITHWGMSGPAILKLSAWGARILNQCNYHFKIRVNWLPEYHQEGILGQIMEVKEVEAKKTVLRTHVFAIPKRLWANLVKASGISDNTKWADVGKQQLIELASQLSGSEFQVNGKSTFKEEFVTAGGVELSEVNFKTFESKLCSGLFFAGEVMNVDAVTGGFNFQNAWTGGHIVAKAITSGKDG
ncbi:MAG: NAD(P)/FAD-dependent oxidoreductase [Sediminicola sp.]|tara:strand:- start:76657 stop:77931 length:1275 start_codon:yes stop_codon:yes gene_type:complete